MKKYIKLYALLAMALFVGSCEDELDFGRDNNKSTTPATIVSGGEIVFGASAAKKSTRTIYGNPFDSNSNDNDSKLDKIELKWVVDDCVQIASRQSVGMAGGVAEYKVTGVADSESGDRSSTATLKRTGAAGLQWGNVDEGTPYDFYAVYPSVNQLKKSIPASVADTCGLTADGKLKGYLPNTQVVKISDESASNNYVFEPNMDYAYMVAKEAYKIPKLDAYGNPIDGQDVSIDLNFSSVVTALKFTIKPGEIGLNNGEISTIRVTDLTLFSASGKELCGAFECDFKTGSYETNNAYSGFSQVAMKLGENGCTLSSGSGSITTTFFLLPIENGYTRGDLMLRIHYYVGDVPQYMTAKLGVDIPVSQMTYINNLTMKPLNASVVGSAWFSALHPNIYVSQVSIPVAGNVFATKDYGAPENNYQQSKKLDELWNMGVRGFEIVTNTTADLTGHLGDCKVMAAENYCQGSGAYTFHKAFSELVGLLKENPKETLIIFATYMAKETGYNPYAYVSNLFNYLTKCTTTSDKDYYITDLSEDDFVQLTTSSTVEQIQGKIVIVVRPGDDERWGAEPFRTSNYKDNPASPYHDNNLALDKYPADGLTNKIATKLGSNDWYKKVMCVWDWGTVSYDVWDRRYGSGYARSAEFNDLGVNAGAGIGAKSQIEKYLYGSNKEYATVGAAIGNFVHSGDKDDNNFNNYGVEPTTMPSLLKTFNFAHNLSNEGTAYVQEWMRVIPEGGIGQCIARARGLFGGNPRSLWVDWPSSIGEKKKAIKDLFEMSIKTKGSTDFEDLYINVLSGYYADPSISVSILPFKHNITTANGDITLNDMGKGGNFQGLAYDLNTYVYDLLSATPGTDKGLSQEGPWGLVIMDHIGNPTTGNEDKDKSKALVNLIMMNNFRFPLAQKSVVQGASVQRVPLSDESVDINKNIMVTWE